MYPILRIACNKLKFSHKHIRYFCSFSFDVSQTRTATSHATLYQREIYLYYALCWTLYWQKIKKGKKRRRKKNSDNNRMTLNETCRWVIYGATPRFVSPSSPRRFFRSRRWQQQQGLKRGQHKGHVLTGQRTQEHKPRLWAERGQNKAKVWNRFKRRDFFPLFFLYKNKLVCSQ